MEGFVIVGLICAAVYFYFKFNTERGANTVRAYLYLRAMETGVSTEEANQAAQLSTVAGSTQIIREAQLYVQSVYGGRQLPMIAEAERLGLRLPNRVRAHATLKHPTEVPADFDTYYDAFIAELKRLSGKARGDLHWVELADDAEIRKAFSDGVDASKLAAIFHQHAKPPLS